MRSCRAVSPIELAKERHALDLPHTHRVAVIGAGPGGISTAVRLRKAGIEDFVVLERASGIGGTWRRNRYPGLSCDIASHFYSFSFAPKSDWSRPFACQPEILAYLEEVVSAFDIRRHIRFDTHVAAAHWDHETARWRLITDDGNTLTAATIVASPGLFGELRYPDSEGAGKRRSDAGAASTQLSFVGHTWHDDAGRGLLGLDPEGVLLRPR